MYLIVCTPEEHKCHNHKQGVRIHIINVNDEIQQNMIVITSYEISQSDSKHNQLGKNAYAMRMPPTPSQNACGTKSLGAEACY